MRKTIVPILKSKIPNFIRYGYPSAFQLIVDFYKWLELDGNYIQLLLQYSDNLEINNDIEPYVDLIISELGWNHKTLIDRKLLVHTLRDFYLSRGSESSFKYLYRILYDVDVNIQYQRDNVFNLSDSTYYKDQWILTTGNSIQSISFQHIYNTVLLNTIVTGKSSGIETTINKISPINIKGECYYKILINNINKSYIPGESIDIWNNTETVTETILNHPIVKIKHPGIGYKIGDVVLLDGFTINGHIVVKSVVTGGITGVNIVNGGYGYSIGDSITTIPTISGHSFYSEVVSVNEAGTITNIKLWSSGYDYISFPDIIVNSKSGGYGAILTGNSNEIGGIKSFDIKEQYWGSNTNSIGVSILTDNGNSAILDIQLHNCVYETELTHINDNKFIGYGSIIFDGNKYQQYSYEVHSTISNSRIDKIVDELLHPVGFNKFKVHIINDEIQLNGIDIELLISKQINRILPTIDMIDVNSTMEIIKNQHYINDSLLFDINNIEYFKFDGTFKYTISDFGNISLDSIYSIGIKNYKTIDPEIIKIQV